MKIAIVGLGYVGLPLARQFVKGSAEVVGLDVDDEKVSMLNNGESYIKHIASDSIAEMVGSGQFQA
jgi:UDP-N-acetyl-D-glucosamine dehydrogenase